MTDQAVDAGGVNLSGVDRSPAATTSLFLGRTRELKELRADIERAGLDTISGRKAPRTGRNAHVTHIRPPLQTAERPDLSGSMCPTS
ncbi:hypothetical protein, partial [Streptomyces sp. NPDC007070]|uniref:hypothetical protein n=1 Tax=Streptomyces sp. NPDC007070 TaxID=3154312 RepID=UPI0033D9DCB3